MSPARKPRPLILWAALDTDGTIIVPSIDRCRLIPLSWTSSGPPRKVVRVEMRVVERKRRKAK